MTLDEEMVAEIVRRAMNMVQAEAIASELPLDELTTLIAQGAAAAGAAAALEVYMEMGLIQP